MRSILITMLLLIMVDPPNRLVAQDVKGASERAKNAIVTGRNTNDLQLYIEVETYRTVGSMRNPIPKPIGKYNLHVMVTNVSNEVKGIYYLPFPNQQFALKLVDARGMTIKKSKGGEQIGFPFVPKTRTLESFRTPNSHGMSLGPHSFGYAISLTPEEYFEILEPGRYKLELELRLCKILGGSGVILDAIVLPCTVELDLDKDDLEKFSRERNPREKEK